MTARRSANTAFLCAAGLFSLALANAACGGTLKFTDFDGPAPNAGGSQLVAINNSGTAVGRVFDADFNAAGFTRSAAGVLHGFALPNSSSLDNPQMQIGGINDQGQVFGYLPTTPGRHGNPLLIFDDGVPVVEIPLPQNFGGSSLRGMNASGVMAGSENDLVLHRPLGFVRDTNGNFTTFDAKPDTLFTSVMAINNNGVVLGNVSILNDITQGFFRFPDGTISLLPSPTSIGGTSVFAIHYTGLNDAGVTVGSFQDIPAGNPGDPQPGFHGFIRDADGNFTLIQNPASPTNSAVLGVNNQGTLLGSYIDAGGIVHGYIAVSSCAGDLNGDQTVSLGDLATLLAHFGAAGGALDGDLNGDGIISLNDLAALLAVFGSTCE